MKWLPHKLPWLGCVLDESDGFLMSSIRQDIYLVDLICICACLHVVRLHQAMQGLLAQSIMWIHDSLNVFFQCIVCCSVLHPAFLFPPSLQWTRMLALELF